MDRRQQKTRRAIFSAFSILLQRKGFEKITVQEIIDEANIGRSTFYAHFETKDELLKAICTDIFQHIFTMTLPQEEEHALGIENLELKLGHILFHLEQHRADLLGIFNSESSFLFIRYLEEYLVDLFQRYDEDFKSSLPQEFILNYLTSSFIATVRWWINQKEPYGPEEVAHFYMTMLRKES